MTNNNQLDIKKYFGIETEEAFQNLFNDTLSNSLNLKDNSYLELEFTDKKEAFGPIVDERNRKIRGWKVCLYRKSESKKNEDDETISDEEINKIRSFLLNFINESKDYKGRLHFDKSGNNIHRGHILGNSLIEQLSELKYNGSDIKSQFDPIDFGFSKGKKNPLNIFPQTKEANINSSTLHGQLYFEQIVFKFLKNDPNESDVTGDKVYYEAEAIYFKPDDLIPIGTRLYIKSIANNLLQYHVFIPNIGEAFPTGRNTYEKGFTLSVTPSIE